MGMQYCLIRPGRFVFLEFSFVHILDKLVNVSSLVQHNLLNQRGLLPNKVSILKSQNIKFITFESLDIDRILNKFLAQFKYHVIFPRKKERKKEKVISSIRIINE